MAFASYEFLLYFLPVTVVGYFLMNRIRCEAGKLFLIVASVLFYFWAAPKLSLVIVASILVNWSCYRFMGVSKPKICKGALIVGVVADIMLLFVYKYYDFFISGMNHVFQTQFILLKLVIPLGISFFTFSQLSFLLDGYHEEFKNCGFVNYVLYVLFFPKLVSGPIVGFTEMADQFDDEERKKVHWSNVAWGMETFILGMGKKILIADLLGGIVSYGFEDVGRMNIANSLIVMLCFTFEIYFDFSGYSDMAIGIAKMMNIELPANFLSPYRAINIKEFWKRWHITLTRFLTKYVYIPLGG